MCYAIHPEQLVSINIAWLFHSNRTLILLMSMKSHALYAPTICWSGTRYRHHDVKHLPTASRQFMIKWNRSCVSNNAGNSVRSQSWILMDAVDTDGSLTDGWWWHQWKRPALIEEIIDMLLQAFRKARVVHVLTVVETVSVFIATFALQNFRRGLGSNAGNRSWKSIE